MSLTRRTCITGLLAAPLALRGGPAPAAAVDVAPGGLAAALQAAAPGSVLRLAPGDHGALKLKGTGGRQDAPVTVTAAVTRNTPSRTG